MNQNGHEQLKLNIGSGDQLTLKGYTNIDAKFGDVAYPLKYEDNSVDECRASHILEHYPQQETFSVLKDWTRVLKPGGVMKIAVPDFDWIAKEQLSGNPNDLPLGGYLMGGQVDEHDFHKAVFSRVTLEEQMKVVGLTNIQPWVSEVKDCASLPVSLNLMGCKPYACPNCFATDGRLFEDRCYHCHPQREQIADEWDERVTRFLVDARGVVRLGANDGEQRDVYAKYGIPVIWVEALPDVYERLQTNIAGYPNNYAFNYLLTDEDGKEYEFGVANNDGKSSSIFAFADHKKLWPKINYTHSIKLKSTRFDTMVRRAGIDLTAYDALIMDLQSAELKALRGMGDLVNGFQWILSEAVDFELYKDGCQLNDLDAYLIPRGFVRVEMFQSTGMRGVGHLYDVLYKRKNEAFRRALEEALGVAKDRIMSPTAPAGSDGIKQSPYAVGLPSVNDDTATGAIIRENNRAEAAQAVFAHPAQVGNGQQYFAAGQWRDVGYQAGQVALETVRVAPIGIATSTPRYGSLLAADNMWQVAIALGAQPARSGGSWWEQGLSRQVEKLLDEGTARGAVEFILTVDFDSYMNPEDGLNLIRLMYENPNLDCICPMQIRRGTFVEILAQSDGPATMSNPLVPIVSGHFGFTVFRRRVFERMSKPWMLNIPDKEGRWGEGRTDADMYFWNKFNDEGFKAAMSTEVIVGHGDEGVCWPKIVDGKCVKVWQSVFEWIQTRKPPEGILKVGVA